MRDIDVRQALSTELFSIHQGDDDTIIVHELGIRQGASRVDIAVVNGRFHGYEIKSEADTLERLPRQIALYGTVFDHMTLVVAENHLDRALAEIPDWWEVKVALPSHHNAVELIPGRPGKANADVDPRSLVELLWRNEALQLLAERNADRGYRSKSRSHIWDRVCEVYELEEIKSAVRQALKTRSAIRERIVEITDQ